MPDFGALELEARVAATLPPFAEVLNQLRKSDRATVLDTLRRADRRGRPVIQPRCGVGDHAEMCELLRLLDRHARPEILTVTIDSFTRLKQFRSAQQALARNPADLNGYPLVTHGWQRGRELIDSVPVPIEIRHGSPDPRELFAVSLAAGFTSFEGGGVAYNLPYSKDVPLTLSMQAWHQVDRLCGELADVGVVVDRELFGTLTAVLLPPSISLTVSMLEAISASRDGVRCLSVAYPQSGEIHQDIAALRSIRVLAERFLPSSVEVFPTLHEFMGVFPHDAEVADALILLGGLTGRLGGASKIISKTHQEARGIPDVHANIVGIRTTALGCTELLDFVQVDEAAIEEEMYWLQREVIELVEPVLAERDLLTAIPRAFADGRLDVPFSASKYAKAEVVPKRDATGAIRYLYTGGLPFSRQSRLHNDQRLRLGSGARHERLVQQIRDDINYFVRTGIYHGDAELEAAS